MVVKASWMWNVYMDNKRLSNLRPGESAVVLSLLSRGEMRRRLLDIGLIPDTVVECVGRSPLADPAAYLIRGKIVAIRDRDAYKIVVK